MHLATRIRRRADRACRQLKQDGVAPSLERELIDTVGPGVTGGGQGNGKGGSDKIACHRRLLYGKERPSTSSPDFEVVL